MDVLVERRKGGGGASTTINSTIRTYRPRSTSNVRRRPSDVALDLSATCYGQTWHAGANRRQGDRSRRLHEPFHVEKEQPATTVTGAEEARRSPTGTRKSGRQTGVERRHPCGVDVIDVLSSARQGHTERHQSKPTRKGSLSPWRTHFSVADESGKVSVSYEEVDADLVHEGGRSTVEFPAKPAISRGGRVGRSRVRRAAAETIHNSKGGSGCSKSDLGGDQRRDGRRSSAEKCANNNIGNHPSGGTYRGPSNTTEPPRQRAVSAPRSERLTTHEPTDNGYSGPAPAISPRREKRISVEAKQNTGLKVRLRVGDGSSSSESSATYGRILTRPQEAAIKSLQGATSRRFLHPSFDVRRSHSWGRDSESGTATDTSGGGKASTRGGRCGRDEAFNETSVVGKRTPDTGDCREDRNSSRQMKRAIDDTERLEGHEPGAGRWGGQSGTRRDASWDSYGRAEGAVVGGGGERGGEEEAGRRERQKSRHEKNDSNRRGRSKSRLVSEKSGNSNVRVKQNHGREGRHSSDDDDELRGWTRQENDWRHGEEDTADEDRRWRCRGRVLWSTHAEPLSRGANASAWKPPDAVDPPDPLVCPTSRSRQSIRPYHGLYAKSLKANGIDPVFFRASKCNRYCCCCYCRRVGGKDGYCATRNVPACTQIDDSLLLRSSRAGDHLAAEHSRAPVDGLPDRLEAGRVLDSLNRRAEILGITPPTSLRAKAAWMENPGDPEYR